MIFAILAALGVPLWLCAVGLLTLVFRGRHLRKRPGSMPVRLRPGPDKRWRRGYGVWVHDVFAFHGSPAAWQESLAWVSDARILDDAEPPKRLGDHPVVVRLEGDGTTLEVAVHEEHRDLLLGPYGAPAA